MDKKNIAKKMNGGQDYEGLIPRFKSGEDAVKFLKLPQRRKCMRCKGKKDKDSGNVFFCSPCVKKKAEEVSELRKKQEHSRKNPHLVPKEYRHWVQ